MASQADQPTPAPVPADETATLVTAAEELAKWAASQKTKGLDFSVDSLGRLDELLEKLAGSKDPITIKTRLGCAAYVGEVMVRRLGGKWGTGEFYGEVLPPGVEVAPGEDEPAGLARPTEMVGRRLAEKTPLKQQVLELQKAWAPAPAEAPAEAPAAEKAAEPKEEPKPKDKLKDEPKPPAGPTPEEIEAAAKAAEEREAQAERLAAEKAQAERIAAEKIKAAEKAAAERIEADRLAAEKVAAERAELERIAAEKAQAERLEAERLAAAKAAEGREAAEKAEAERLAAEKVAAEKAEVERIAAEKAQAERREAERLEAEKAQAERIAAAEKAAAEKAEADRLAAEQAAIQKAEAEKLLAEQAGTMMNRVAETFVGPATANGAVWLDYSRASVMLLDDLIAAWWPPSPEKGTYESMIPAMGAYIGEVLVREAGGRWIRDPNEGYAVDLNGRVIFPMRQVAGRFEMGRSQSIGKFFAEAAASPPAAAQEQPAKAKRRFFHRG